MYSSNYHIYRIIDLASDTMPLIWEDINYLTFRSMRKDSISARHES